MPRSVEPIDPTDHRRRPAGFVAVGLLLTLALTAAGCSNDDASTDAGAAPDETMDDGAMTDEGAMDDEARDDEGDDGSDSGEAAGTADVLTLQLTDVDGSTFTLADYAGTPVLVENFATWCPNCRAQLEHNQAAAAATSDAAFVALSTETDLGPGDVAAYASENGFDDIRFAILTDEQLAFFSEAYGNSAINPPSTPHWFISADGEVGELITGTTEADAIPAMLGL